MASFRAKVTEGGRVVIPAEFRRQLGVQPGADVVLEMADGELRIRSLRQAVERAQALVRNHVAPGRSLADELIEQRHEAAGLE